MHVVYTMLALFLPVFAVSAQVASEKPNLVLIVADDLGLGDLGAYGQTRIQTPNLDSLAGRGTLFARAYASAPVCAPSRCGILTGLDTEACPIQENTYPEATLPASTRTIARALQTMGYRTGLFGKWGLGGELRDGTLHDPASTPWRLGFSTVWTVLSAEHAQSHRPAWVWSERGRESYSGEYFDDDVALRAAAFMKQDDTPFFVYVALTAPHRAFIDVATLTQNAFFGAGVGACARMPDVPEPECAYASMVERMDSHVGYLLQAVNQLAQHGHRTVVLFTSDNGAVSVDGHSAPFWRSTAGFLGEKRTLLEGGIRVPLIVFDTAQPEGQRIERAVSLLDVPSTLQHLARNRENGQSLLTRNPMERALRFSLFDGARERARIDAARKTRCVYRDAETTCTVADVGREAEATDTSVVDFGPPSPAHSNAVELVLEGGAAAASSCMVRGRPCFAFSEVSSLLRFRITLPAGPYRVYGRGLRVLSSTILFGRQEYLLESSELRSHWVLRFAPRVDSVFGAEEVSVWLLATPTHDRSGRGVALVQALLFSALSVVSLYMVSRRSA